MAGLPPPCGTTRPFHPLGVQPEEELITEGVVTKLVLGVKILMKARDALELIYHRVEHLDLDAMRFEERGDVLPPSVHAHRH